MRYVGTRGEPGVSFLEALLSGLAPGGGLYVPQFWPRFSNENLAALAGRSYSEIAAAVIAPFVGEDIAHCDLRAIIAETYRGFAHNNVAPLVQIGPQDFLLQLFHGPTLAFKDIALQLLARLYEHVLKSRGGTLTIVCATSGDTGSAAIEAIGSRRNMQIFVLYPKGRVSEIQRRQMTCTTYQNAHVIAIDGTFDDCQRIVKDLFADASFAHDLSLTGVNSINWARIMAQAVYYISSALALGAPAREVSYVVPSGNFGDIYAGFVAAQMGLPVKRLVIATNQNDILVRTLETGRYEKRGVYESSSPSMDIEIASNFERLVFEATGRDHACVSALFSSLAQGGAFDLPATAHGFIKQFFSAARADDNQVKAAIGKHWHETGTLVDPHTATGLVALGAARAGGAIAVGDCSVVLATAHAAKFPHAVEEACAVRPGLPPRYDGLTALPERQTHLAADAGAVKSFIRAHAA